MHKGSLLVSRCTVCECALQVEEEAYTTFIKIFKVSDSPFIPTTLQPALWLKSNTMNCNYRSAIRPSLIKDNPLGRITKPLITA